MDAFMLKGKECAILGILIPFHLDHADGGTTMSDHRDLIRTYKSRGAADGLEMSIYIESRVLKGCFCVEFI
jgi:hypothetical protein